MNLENILDIFEIIKRRRFHKREDEKRFFNKHYLECKTCRFRNIMHLGDGYIYEECALTGKGINCYGCSGYKPKRKYLKYQYDKKK